jgi:hypothetical protein
MMTNVPNRTMVKAYGQQKKKADCPTSLVIREMQHQTTKDSTKAVRV